MKLNESLEEKREGITGFTGKNCDKNIIPCSENPCQNNAVCLYEDDQPVCYCVPDYHGTFCELRYDDCESKNAKCENGGTCIDGVNNFTCSCPPPYAGEMCTLITTSTTTEEEEYETTLMDIDYTSIFDFTDESSTDKDNDLTSHTEYYEAPPGTTTELSIGVIVEDYSTTYLSSEYSIGGSTIKDFDYSTVPDEEDETIYTIPTSSPGMESTLDGVIAVTGFTDSYEFTTSSDWMDKTTRLDTSSEGRAIDADYDETINNNSLTATSKIVTMLPTTLSSSSTVDPLATDKYSLSIETTSSYPSQEDFITVTEFHKTTFGTEFDKSEVTVVPTTQFHACTKDQCANVSLCLHNSTQVC